MNANTIKQEVEKALEETRKNASPENRKNLNYVAQQLFKCNPKSLEAAKNVIAAGGADPQEVAFKAIEAAISAV